MSAAAMAPARSAASVRGATRFACGIPAGRRSPRGGARWYLLRVPEGREVRICNELRRIVPASLLDDVFMLRRERWIKLGGAWRLETVPLYSGYAFVVSRDAAGLAKTLAKLTVPAELVGAEGRAWVPLADEAAAWYAGASDASRVIRNSTGVVEGGELRVFEGPLVGQEERVSRIDRHKRCCRVHVGDADGGFEEWMPLEVPVKS